MGLIAGISIGTIVLGVGSRIAMRGIVLLSGGTPGFSIGGSATVILLGALSGLAGAAVFGGLRVALPRKPILRSVLFWAFLILVALRGLRPVDLQRLSLFMPLILGYGITLQTLWCRLESGRRAPSDAPVGAAA
jgi:hypothetical protein